MADTKLTGLTETSVPVAADIVYTVDVSDTTDDPAGTSRNLTIQRLLGVAPLWPGGRLTPVTGVPITESSGSSTIYFTPYIHNVISLWDGTRWLANTFSEVSLALGTMTSGANYDIFGFLSSGVFTLEKLIWTNDTTRATAVTIQDGRYCKSGDKTRLLLGTIRSISTTQTADFGNGLTAPNRFISNVYNRVPRTCVLSDTTDTWTYSTASYRQANNSTANQAQVVSTLGDSLLSLTVIARVKNATIGTASTAIGEDSTTVRDGSCIGMRVTQQVASKAIMAMALLTKYPAVGYHYYAWLEQGSGAGTDTWLGDNADNTTEQNGMSGWIMN